MQQIVPLFGTGNKGRSRFASVQRRINLFLEVPKDADKSGLLLYGRPGLKVYGPMSYIVGSTRPPAIRGSIRGLIGCSYTQVTSSGAAIQRPVVAVYANGNYVYANYDNSGTAICLYNGADAPLKTLSGNVVFADNGYHCLMVDGVTGYVIQYNTSTTAPLPVNGAGPVLDPDFPLNPSTTTFIAGRFIVNAPGYAGRFYWSDLNDGSAWDGLNYATAESSPDALVNTFECNGTLNLIGTQTTEFWALQTTGAAFGRVGGAGMDWGTTARDSVRKFQNGYCMLARNRGGDRQVVFVQGYSARVISDPDVERAINEEPSVDSAVGQALTIEGHPLYLLNLPNSSWMYDGQNGTWSEWQTDDQRWAGNFIAPDWTGGHLVTDYRNDTFYTIDAETFADGDSVLAREVTTKHLFNNYERLSVDKLTVDCQVGSPTVPDHYNAIAVDFTGGLGTTTSGALDMHSTSFSLQFKVTINSDRPIILFTAQNSTWSVGSLLGLLYFYTHDGGRVNFPAIFAMGARHAVAITYDGRDLKFYVDKVLVASRAYTTAVGTESAGALFFVSVPYSLDDFRVWGLALTALQIDANTDEHIVGSPPGLMALWNSFVPGQRTYLNRAANGGTLTLSAGVGFVPTPDEYVGPGRPPQMMLQVSKDNGNTYGEELWQSMGLVGQYTTRTAWRRLGRGRDFVFKLRVTDPVAVAITGGAVVVSP